MQYQLELRSKHTELRLCVCMYVYLYLKTEKTLNNLGKLCCPLAVNFTLTSSKKENQLTIVEISLRDIVHFEEKLRCFLHKKVVTYLPPHTYTCTWIHTCTHTCRKFLLFIHKNYNIHLTEIKKKWKCTFLHGTFYSPWEGILLGGCAQLCLIWEMV